MTSKKRTRQELADHLRLEVSAAGSCPICDEIHAALLERPQEATGGRIQCEATMSGDRCLRIAGHGDEHRGMVSSWQPVEPQGWQPIDTAPEGRDFMAWIEDKNGVGWMEPRCCLNEYGKFKMWTWELDYGCEYSDPPRGYTPTHWMPLPSAPVTKEGDA